MRCANGKGATQGLGRRVATVRGKVCANEAEKGELAGHATEWVRRLDSIGEIETESDEDASEGVVGIREEGGGGLAPLQRQWCAGGPI